MSIRKLLSIVATLGLFASLASASLGTRDELLKKQDHKKLAKGVSAYWQANIDKKKINDAFVKLSGELEKINKKLKGPDVLSSMDDWRQVFWIASRDGLGNVGAVKKNKITTWPQLGAQFPGFTYFAPKKHSAKKGAFPLILTIADEGVEPTAHLDAEWAEDAIRAGYIVVVVEMREPVAGSGKPKRGARGNPIPVDQWGGQAGAYAVFGTFANLTRSEAFAIDFDRVYLAGTGKGFDAAAATAEWFPQSFAGLVGRGEISKDLYSINLINLPTMVAGESEGASDFADGIKRLGFTECARGAESASEIGDWMAGQVRNAYPTKIKFQYPSNNTLRSYWIEASGVDVDADGGSKLEASVDRATNTITIDAVQVGSVVISYNDLLVDMDKPVTLVINGKTEEEVLKRNPRILVDSVFRERDWGILRTAQATYPVEPLASDKEE